MASPLRITVGGSTSTRRRKPETETLAEKLAFNDPDRTTPLHDDICLWLDVQLVEEAFVRTLLPRVGTTWKPEYVQGVIGEYRKVQLQSSHKPTLPRAEWMDTSGRLRSHPTEQIAADQERYDRDLADWSERERRWTTWAPSEPPAVELEVDVTWEKAIGNERWVSGFIDLVATVTWPKTLEIAPKYCGKDQEPFWNEDWQSRTLAFEVKSTIPSLGELIRQVRYYESKYPATYFVVAPSTEHIETLARQRIGFIEFPTGVVRLPGG